MPSTQILVIGNGESRLALDLPLLAKNKITVGCNAVHRDFAVDHLICCDQRMVNEALTNPLNTKIYTRPDWADKYQKFGRVFRVPDLPYKGEARWDQPFHWGSGSYALLKAAELGNDIELIGFDLVSKDKLVNNVYKGTSNYLTPDKPAVDPTYWIHQFYMVFRTFPDKYFTVYNTNEWTIPKTWKLANVSFKDIDTLTANTVY
jgi:hypothetical protein